MASFLYNAGKVAVLDGAIDLDDDTIKVALVTSDYSADKENHEFFNDITSEVTGSGYTAGGSALSGADVTQGSPHRAVFDASDLTWTNSTITARAAILYKDSGDPATSPLIAYIDFGQDFSSSGDDLTLEWDADGIFYVGESS